MMRQHEDLGDVCPEFDEDGPMPLECEICWRERQDARYRPFWDRVLCDSCADNWSKRVQAASDEAYYGLSTPQTDGERSQQALADKRGR